MKNTFRDTRSYKGKQAGQTPSSDRPFVRVPNDNSGKGTPYGGNGDLSKAGRVLNSDQQKYGNVITQPFNAPLGLDLLILGVPDTQRVFLLIQNLHATLDLYVNFGAPASAINGFTVKAGGNLFMDAFVSQDEIHVAGSTAIIPGTLGYANTPPFGTG